MVTKPFLLEQHKKSDYSLQMHSGRKTVWDPMKLNLTCLATTILFDSEEKRQKPENTIPTVRYVYGAAASCHVGVVLQEALSYFTKHYKERTLYEHHEATYQEIIQEVKAWTQIDLPKEEQS